MLAQRVPQPAARELPLGLRLVHQLGQRDPGPERLVDARRRGQQGVLVDGAGAAVGPLLRPGDAAERQLHRRRPSPARGAPSASTGPRTPGRGGRASGARPPTARYADMLVSPLASSTSPATILHRPRAVGTLTASAQAIGALRRGVLAGDRQRHRGLEVVPDVGVLPGRPGDGAVGLLHGHDRRRRRSDLARASARRAPRGSARLAEVEDQALADDRVEHPLGDPGGPRPLHDVPDQQPVVRLDGRVGRRCRRRRRTSATSTASAGRARSPCRWSSSPASSAFVASSLSV